MANPQRGELSIELAGKTYTMRPTFNALCEIEEALGMGLLALMSDMQRNPGALTMRTTACIIWGGIKGGAESGQAVPTLAEIGEAIVRGGFARVSGTIGAFLGLAFGGDQGNA